ncbi:MAG: hypothetical protein ACFUZC_17145 [Chthoniobacteraceae bacterium]
MPSPRNTHSAFRSTGGFAVILVLAFVVLLTGLIVAFFSRSILARQSSNAVVSQTRVDLFARGAVDQIIGDLKQEIADGSTVTTTSGTLYVPKAPANMLPRLVGSSGSNGLENLLKISLSGSAFYSGANYSASGALRAAAISTSGTSLNGRYITPARWNAVYMMPVSSASNAAPSLASGSFPMPDWILVDRHGNTPASSGYSSALAWSASGSSSIVGRYAYAIYHEGGMLDINAAGFPSNSYLTGASGTSLLLAPYYKSSLAFADLGQLTGTASTALLSSSDIEQIVGWRNYASASGTGVSLSAALSGTLPGLSWSAASGSNYYTYVLSNTTGFLRASRNSLVNSSGAFGSDQMFASRQDLIGFFQRVLNSSSGLGADAKTSHLNALNYLATFTRDLNQPSLIPASSQGGPTINADDDSGGNDYHTKDTQVNPIFLNMRVTTTTQNGRNNGSDLKAGDPLVNKRFALNRLAWLTYAGPIASSSTSYNSSLDSTYVSNLKAYGFTDDFLLQGTADNIYKYFGLSWVSATVDGAQVYVWAYNHKGTTTLSAPPTQSSAERIKLLSDVLDANREPDFFELLKAAVNVGAVAKGATAPSGADFEKSQSNRDTCVDYAILHIGANIIDQYDQDGYPTIIRCAIDSTASDGGAKEIRGVENLPYFYRGNIGWVEAQDPDPLPSVRSDSDAGDGYPSPGLNRTGVMVALFEPQIWNPHDQSSSLGSPRPQNVRFVIDSAPLDATGAALEGGYNTVSFYAKSDAGVNSTNASTSIPSTSFWNNYQPEAVKLTSTTTELDFDVPDNTLYREPTLLFQSGLPANSNLTIGSGNYLATKFSSDARYNTLLSSTGVTAVNPVNSGGATYVGGYLGIAPVRWAITKSGTTKIYTVHPASTTFSSDTGDSSLTVRMQYKNASSQWLTYDEKYGRFPTGPQIFIYPATSGTHDTGASVGRGGDLSSAQFSVADPRTSRFGLVSGYKGDASAWCATANTISWISSGSATITSMWSNNGTSSLAKTGYGNNNQYFVGLPSVNGWYLGGSGLGGTYYSGLLSTNGTNASASYTSSTYFSDPDGVVRRGMAAYWPGSSTVGLPIAKSTLSTTQTQSRPIVLNRPFRTVGDLGYIFSDTPWRNLDMSTPESGFSGLLDVFCINDTADSSGLAAGKVNLNTCQRQVLQAILAGAYRDELQVGTSGGATISGSATTSLAALVSGSLTARTAPSQSGSMGALANISELVGKWVSSQSLSGGGIDGSKSYSGLSGDLAAAFSSAATSSSYSATDKTNDQSIQRFREASIRALAASGQTRVWNLLIDVIAQVGRYPQGTSGNLNRFSVEGEQHYWVHVAIDRLTGAVLDKQVEVVRE